MIGYFSQIGSCFTRKPTMVVLIDILAALSFCCDVYLAMMMDVSGAVVFRSVFRSSLSFVHIPFVPRCKRGL